MDVIWGDGHICVSDMLNTSSPEDRNHEALNDEFLSCSYHDPILYLKYFVILLYIFMH